MFKGLHQWLEASQRGKPDRGRADPESRHPPRPAELVFTIGVLILVMLLLALGAELLLATFGA
jgi:hypothetical protein